MCQTFCRLLAQLSGVLTIKIKVIRISEIYVPRKSTKEHFGYEINLVYNSKQFIKALCIKMCMGNDSQAHYNDEHNICWFKYFLHFFFKYCHGNQTYFFLFSSTLTLLSILDQMNTEDNKQHSQ